STPRSWPTGICVSGARQLVAGETLASSRLRYRRHTHGRRMFEFSGLAPLCGPTEDGVGLPPSRDTGRRADPAVALIVLVVRGGWDASDELVVIVWSDHGHRDGGRVCGGLFQ